MRPVLHICLFGPFEARLDARLLPPPDRHDTVRLLAYLLLHRDRPLARKTVAFTLWPDHTERQARANLSRTLYRLQRTFLPASEDRPSMIDASPSALRWNGAAPCTVDVAIFQAAYARWCRGPVDQPVAALAEIEALVALYRGDFLQDYADEWAETARAELIGQFENALDRLAHLAAALGRLDDALGTATRLLARDPTRETTHRLVIYAHYAAGDRSAALRQLRACEAALREQVDAEPEPATTDLAVAIRAAQPAAALAPLVLNGILATGSVFDGKATTFGAEDSPSEHDGESSAPKIAGRNLSAGCAPSFHTTLVGREAAIEALRGLIATHRLLTLTGPGGIGKTRLAAAVAERWSDRRDRRVVWVDLSPVTDASSVPPAVGAAFGVALSTDGDLLPLLAQEIGGTQALLVLDNCEQVLDAVATLVRHLLDHCPHLVLLATSRMRLNLAAELAWSTPPLAPPQREPDDGWSTDLCNSLALFVDRVAQRQPDRSLSAADLQCAAGICAGMDGLPLAIELAAAQAAYSSLPELEASIRRDLGVLRGGARDLPARHATLRAAIGGSVERLGVPEVRLFEQLSVFRGGATRAAIAAVRWAGQDGGTGRVGGDGGDGGVGGVGGVSKGDGHGRNERAGGDEHLAMDALAALVDQSLVTLVFPSGAPARYGMLELVRRFAGERLAESGDADRAAGAHAAYYLEWVTNLYARLTGPDQAQALGAIDAEHPNCLAALRRSLAAGDTERALCFCIELWPYWSMRGLLEQGRALLADVLELPGAPRHPDLLARAHNAAGGLAHLQGDYAAARTHYEASIAIERKLAANLQGPGASQRLPTVLTNLSHVLRRQGDFEGACALCEESLARLRAIDDPAQLAATLSALGTLCFRLGRFDEAAVHYQECLAHRRQRADRLDIASAEHNVAMAEAALGRYAPARRRIEAAIAVNRELSDQGYLALSLCLYGSILLRQGEADAAALACEESLRLCRRMGDRSGIAAAQVELGRIDGDDDARLNGAQGRAAEALRLRLEIGEWHVMAELLDLIAWLRMRRGESESAAFLLGVAERQRAATGAGLDAGRSRDRRRCLAVIRRHIGAAALGYYRTLGAAAAGEAGQNVGEVERIVGTDPRAEDYRRPQKSAAGHGISPAIAR